MSIPLFYPGNVLRVSACGAGDLTREMNDRTNAACGMAVDRANRDDANAIDETAAARLYLAFCGDGVVRRRHCAEAGAGPAVMAHRRR